MRRIERHLRHLDFTTQEGGDIQLGLETTDAGQWVLHVADDEIRDLQHGRGQDAGIDGAEHGDALADDVARRLLDLRSKPAPIDEERPDQRGNKHRDDGQAYGNVDGMSRHARTSLAHSVQQNRGISKSPTQISSIVLGTGLGTADGHVRATPPGSARNDDRGSGTMDDDLDNDIAGEPEIVLIAAVGRNGVIGRDNGMPWRLPTDFKHFKKLTMGRPMVMGRKTFQSIGRPLPGRTSIVISRDPGYAAEGVLTASSLDAALMLAGAIAERDEVGEIFVVGGGQVYEEALPLAARVELTEVDLAPEGDTVFPVLDPRAWQEVARVRPERGAQDDAEMCFVTFRRRAR